MNAQNEGEKEKRWHIPCLSATRIEKDANILEPFRITNSRFFEIRRVNTEIRSPSV